jgi:hypothetical protein
VEGNSREREREGLTVGKVVGKGGRIKGGKGGRLRVGKGIRVVGKGIRVGGKRGRVKCGIGEG